VIEFYNQLDVRQSIQRSMSNRSISEVDGNADFDALTTPLLMHSPTLNSNRKEIPLMFSDDVVPSTSTTSLGVKAGIVFDQSNLSQRNGMEYDTAGKRRMRTAGQP
jgi:hypothetical protein